MICTVFDQHTTIMPVPASHKVYILAKRPTDRVEPDTFSLQTRPTPWEHELRSGEVLVRNIAFSNDPAQRLWMDGSVDPVRLHFSGYLAAYETEEALYSTDTVRRGDSFIGRRGSDLHQIRQMEAG
jgi:NADPH-dependent curcumin reductase CurA